MLNRAYSLLTIKAVDAERRVITGTATTPDVDRVGDVVEPRGAKFASAIPLLLFHDHTRPVGTVKLAKPTDDGIEFTASIPKVDDPGPLKDRVEEAWQSIKSGIIRGVSIGFRVLDDGIELMRSGGVRFTAFEILELSLVSVPANAAATIATIKSLDASHLAATGTEGAAHTITPGASGQPVRSRALPRGAMAKTITEQISSFQGSRDTKSARMTEIMTKAADEGVTLDLAQQEEYDTLKGEVDQIDKHLVRLADLEAVNRAQVKTVNGTTSVDGTNSRGTDKLPVIQIKDNVPPGIGMARATIAKIVARLDGCTASEVAKSRWPDHSGVQKYLSVQKATIPAALTTDANWAGNLVDPTNLASEFLEFLRPQTIIGRIPGLRRVPFNVRITGQATGAVANWVGSGKPKPVTSFSTSATTLLWAKIAAIAVLTEEIVRFSSPSAEALVRDELARAVIERMDVDFIDPAHTAVANVNPASITNGLTALTSAGTSADNVRTDLTNILGDFINANVNPSGLVLVMPNSLAMALTLMVNSLGQPEFPGMTINGGSLHGIPVVTSQYAANQSGAGNLVIAINAGDVALADDGNVRIDASGEASIQMSDAPTNDAATGTGQSLVSMYQTNSIAVRAERFINWAKLRTSAVVYMDDVNWGSVGSPS